MSQVTFWVWLVVGAAFARGADLSLATARRAQALLGPEVWSQVIRVENDARLSRYPRVFHALVFELADVLWFYTDTDGTQSFSLRRGRLAEEKADFAPLLRDIEPGFKRWSIAPDGNATPGELPHGCFIESIAALRERLARGGETAHPQLLTFYRDTPSGLVGHTVLTFAQGRDVEVIDSEVSANPWHFPVALAGDALALARAVGDGVVIRARMVSLEEFAAAVGRFASHSSADEIVTLR